MSGAPDTPAGVSVTDRVEAEIEALIRRRRLKPGDRLPAERTLAQQLGASRTSVRGAIGRLAATGRITVRRTGPVVGQPAAQTWVQDTISAPLASLVADHAGYGHDVMEIRYALEGSAAYHAALRADDAARGRIGAALAAMDHTGLPGAPADEARLDAAFHLAIAEASQNAILHRVMSSLFGLLQASISQSLEKLYSVPQVVQTLSRQHRALHDAIVAGDADGARAASDAHLRFVETTMKQIDDDLARRARARAAGIHPNH